MSMLKAVGDYFKSKAEKVPGLGYVVTVLSGIAAVVLNKPEEDLDLVVIWIVWLVAFVFYFFAGFLDDVIFDPLYGVQDPTRKGWARAWRKCVVFLFFPVRLIVDRLPKTAKLDQTRNDAAKKLTGNGGCEGIYESAHTLFGKSDEWEGNVKTWLDLSKATRAFIIPALIIFVLDVLADSTGIVNMKAWLNYRILSWFAQWKVALIALGLLLILSIWFRVRHMVALYELVEKSEVSEASIPTIGKDGVPMVIVGKVIIPKKELPIFKGRPQTSK